MAPPTSGRTFWDILFSLRISRALVAVLLLMAATLLILLWYFVHSTAEPGTEISLFGLVKYQKARAVATTTAPAVPSAETLSCAAAKVAAKDAQVQLADCKTTAAAAAAQRSPIAVHWIPNTFSTTSECKDRLSIAAARAAPQKQLNASEFSLDLDLSPQSVFMSCRFPSLAMIVVAGGPSDENATRIAAAIYNHIPGK